MANEKSKKVVLLSREGEVLQEERISSLRWGPQQLKEGVRSKGRKGALYLEKDQRAEKEGIRGRKRQRAHQKQYKKLKPQSVSIHLALLKKGSSKKREEATTKKEYSV